MDHPFLVIPGARRIGAEAIPEPPLGGERWALPQVTGDLNCGLVGNDLPRPAREKPAASLLHEERRYRLTQAQGTAGQQVGALPIAADAKTLGAEVVEVDRKS